MINTPSGRARYRESATYEQGRDDADDGRATIGDECTTSYIGRDWQRQELSNHTNLGDPVTRPMIRPMIGHLNKLAT